MTIKTASLQNRALITVTKKGAATFDLPIMNKVMLGLFGDLTDLDNLAKELKQIKQFVNKEVNIKGFALKDVNVKIEFVEA